MITIPLQVCGDVWCDPEQFSAALDAAPLDQSIMIDLRAEGPSLAALGILDALRLHCSNTARDPASVRLINSPNNAEITEFQNTHRGRSHFFFMSSDYWQPAPALCDLANRFAMFVGRTTVARCSMMYQLYHDPVLGQHFKFSTMRYDGLPIWDPYPGWRVMENFDDWLSPDEFRAMTQWWSTARPASLDEKRVQDQYSPEHNTNRSLLGYYVHFNIELVAETYTLGCTFFPTEKTVRPIVAARPFIIYAAPHFLERLRDMGFRTYHDCWDESYDHLQGPSRWHEIRKVLDHLAGLSDIEFRDLMQAATDIACYNRRVLADLVLTQKAHLLRQSHL